MYRSLAILVLSGLIALPAWSEPGKPESVFQAHEGLAAEAAGFRRSAEASGSDAKLFARAAEAYARAGMPEPALEMQQRAVALKPGDARLLSRQADYANWGKHYSLAEGSYRAWIELESESREAWLGLARAQSWRGSLDASASSYSQYRKLMPEDSIALAEYARVLSYRGDYPQALDVIESYREIAGETAEYRRVKASLLAWGDRPNAALEITRAGLGAEPTAEPIDAELICSEAVALNHAREFRRSLARLEDCAELAPSGVDLGLHRSMLTRSSKPLSIRGIRHRSPYRQDYDWEYAELLRPVALLDSHYRGSSDSIHSVEGSLAAYSPLNPELYIGAVSGYEHLWAELGSGFETKGGKKDIGYGFAAAELEARIVENVWLGVRAGADVTAQSDASVRYRLALDVRPWDELELALVQEQRIVSYSPMSVSRGIWINSTQLLARFSPDLRTTIEAGGAYEFLADDNNAWNVFFAPRRAVLRRQHVDIDLGLRGEWRGFERRANHGYFDPEFFQRYVATLRLSSQLRERIEFHLFASLGFGRDETTDGVEPVGDLVTETIFHLADDWRLKMRAGATATIGTRSDYTGWFAGLRGVRRF